jgi:hypothetical protein
MAGKQQIAELTAELRALREELARVRTEQAAHSCFQFSFPPPPQPAAPLKWWHPLQPPQVTCVMPTSAGTGAPNISTMVLNSTAGTN